MFRMIAWSLRDFGNNMLKFSFHENAFQMLHAERRPFYSGLISLKQAWGGNDKTREFVIM